MKSAAAIAFDYQPSRWLIAAAVVMLTLALAAVTLSGFNATVRIALGLAAIAYAALALRRFARVQVMRAAWHEAGHWRVVDTSGVDHLADLSHAVVRGDWIVLNLRRSDGTRLPIVLAPDNSDNDLRRRLRVRLARGMPDAPATV
jgi:toxin CptA